MGQTAVDFLACATGGEGQVMEMLLWILTAAVLLSAAGYAQLRIARYTAGTTRVALTRAVLIVVGIGFGYVAARTFADGQSIPASLVFLTGFGLVHFPAAIILFIKRERGAGKS